MCIRARFLCRFLSRARARKRKTSVEESDDKCGLVVVVVDDVAVKWKSGIFRAGISRVPLCPGFFIYEG